MTNGSNRNGGADLHGKKIDVGQDVVGRDKIETTTSSTISEGGPVALCAVVGIAVIAAITVLVAFGSIVLIASKMPIISTPPREPPTAAATSQNPPGTLPRPTANSTLLSQNTWINETDMLSPREYFGAVAHNGYVYAIGGRSTSSIDDILNTVEYARINPDGSLGAWQPAPNMIRPRSFLSVVQANGYLYAIGGVSGDGDVAQSVERATIGADGSLSKWQTVGSMNQQRYAFAAVEANGYIYVLGGATGYQVPVPGKEAMVAEMISDIERAQIQVDGTLGEWETIGSMRTQRAMFCGIVSGRYLFAIGGADIREGSSKSTSRVEWTTIASDGSLGEWNLNTPLAVPVEGHATVATGGRLIVLGGDQRSSPESTIQVATINHDGTLSEWITSENLLPPRTGLAAVIADDLYVLGGHGQRTYNSAARMIIQ